MSTQPFQEKPITGVNPLQKQRKPKLHKLFNGARNIRTFLQSTHIQEFLQLSDNVGMFYPKNRSVPSIDFH